MRAAGLVQSRSFHVRAENWLTGQQVEGKARSFMFVSLEHACTGASVCASSAPVVFALAKRHLGSRKA